MARTPAPKGTDKTSDDPPFLENQGNEPSKDFREQDPNYGATNPFMPVIEEGIPALTYYMLKANLAVPIPREMISSKNKGWDKKKDEPILIEYANVTDLKDLLDERVGVWTAEVTEFKQIGNSMCLVVRLSIFASDGVWHSDGTGIEPLDTNSFGDPFSNAYAQGFRRACEGHGMGREMWRKSEHVEASADASQPPDNSERPEHSQERADYSPMAKSLGDMVTAKQLGLIRSIAREANIDADKECALKLNCSIDELSKRAASDLIEHLTQASRQNTAPPPRTHTGPARAPEPAARSTEEAPKDTGPPASGKQKDYIKNVCSDRGLNEELISLELFKQNFDEITKGQASQMIEHLVGKK